MGLYNHGGWFGEPENQIEVIKELQLPNVGIVYNFHHGHDQVARLPTLLQKMMPYLYVININGMVTDGERRNLKIVPIGQGDLDIQLLEIVRSSGYKGPIGILNHTQENAEKRLDDNLKGLRWVVDTLSGKTDKRPEPQTWKRPTDLPIPEIKVPSINPNAAPAPNTGAAMPYQPELVAQLAAEVSKRGDARRGAQLFTAATSACLSCHRISTYGGKVGPDLTLIATQQTPEQIIESVLWPQRQVKPEYVSHTVLTTEGQIVRGYMVRNNPTEIVLRDTANQQEVVIKVDDVETSQASGSLMPDGALAQFTLDQKVDLMAFLCDLGKYKSISQAELESLLDMAHPHAPASFTYDRKPINEANWPYWQAHVNRERIYDFYAKQARYFREICPRPKMLPEFPGLDGGTAGHWGNQSEPTWIDGRWNDTDIGTLLSGVFHAEKLTVPRGVCVRVDAQTFACFDPDKLQYVYAWSDKFLKFSDVRHGFMHGLTPAGPRREVGPQASAQEPSHYVGFYRSGDRVAFAYRRGDQVLLDVPTVKDGKLVSNVAPLNAHPDKQLASGGPAQWPDEIVTSITLGSTSPYAIDSVELPFKNPWNSLMFIGDHDFLPDGTALLCTMQGDVWRVKGLEPNSTKARWRRIASGLHHALGIVTSGSEIYVLGRDQITRLHDLNHDEEIDFYECFSRACDTSPAGHDFTCGLWRDAEGNFYTASGKQGLVKISADGQRLQVLATGLRNPDGLGLYPDGTVTVPSSEGDWVPASQIGIVPAGQSGKYFGHGGPRDGKAPDLPLIYLPRGLDNSSGGQVFVSSDRWGPVQGQMVHLSYGAASHFLLLRDEVAGTHQGAVVQLPGEFRSSVHRGRFNPVDGQLYVSGMGGWGNYSSDDGCFERVRFHGDPTKVQLPIGFHVHENGITVRFTQPVNREVATTVANQFAQAWNYRYSGGYGSAEYSTRHPDLRGHDTLEIPSVHVVGDGRELFVSLPDLQPVNQLHLALQTDVDQIHDIYLTVHKLDAPRTDLPDYQPREKLIAAHPLLVDLARATRTKRNPHEKAIPEARDVVIETGDNLSFKTRRITAKAGEAIKLTLDNPDVVPHNWALLKPGTLNTVGDLANKLIADPDAAARQYIPDSKDVLYFTDVVGPHSKFVIYFRAPAEPGRYPICAPFQGTGW